jgi:N-acetylglutamate synthase
MQTKEVTMSCYWRLIEFWNKNYSVSGVDNANIFRTFLEKNPHLSIFVEKDGEIIGTALGSYDGRRGYLQKVVVSSYFRRHGVGTKLVKEVVRRLKSIGAIYIPISVEESLLSFYEKCGFTRTHSVPMTVDLR